MEYVIETIDYKGYEIQIVPDEDPEDPRQWDNLGTMVCFHKRYQLGDKHDYNPDDYNDWDEVEQAIIKREDPLVILPLYLYDHSGLRIKIGSFRGLLPQGHAEWDSGQVGFIFVPREKFEQEFNGNKIEPGQRQLNAILTKQETEEQIRKATAILEAEVDTYDKYLSGEVYGFRVVKPCKCNNWGNGHKNEIESCYGYYDIQDAISEAKAIIDRLTKAKVPTCNNGKPE